MEIDCEDDYQNLIESLISKNTVILVALQKHSVFAAIDKLDEKHRESAGSIRNALPFSSESGSNESSCEEEIIPSESDHQKEANYGSNGIDIRVEKLQEEMSCRNLQTPSPLPSAKMSRVQS